MMKIGKKMYSFQNCITFVYILYTKFFKFLIRLITNILQLNID